MTQEQFIYWFQGFCELGGGQVPSQQQWDSIRAHLNTVFNKVTPPVAPSGARQLLNEQISKAAEKAWQDRQRLTPLGQPKDIVPFWPQHPSAPFMPQSPLGPLKPGGTSEPLIC